MDPEVTGKNESEENETSTNFDEVVLLLGKNAAIRLLEITLPDVEFSLATIYDMTIPISNKIDQIHKSVGSTAVLGLLELSEALSEAEAMALKGQDPIYSPLPKYIENLLNEAKVKLITLTHAEDQEDYFLIKKFLMKKFLNLQLILVQMNASLMMNSMKFNVL